MFCFHSLVLRPAGILIPVLRKPGALAVMLKNNKMIRATFILTSLIFFGMGCKGQTKNYFEGKVIYQFELISKNTRLDSNKLRTIFGTGSILTFKKGNYHHTYNGGLMEFDTYRKDDNKMYFKMRNNDTIYWRNCGLIGDKIEKFEFSAKKEDVLGISCDELTMHYNDNIVSHYYNSDSLSIDPEWFKQYTLHDENLIDAKEKSIYLKSKVEYAYFLIIETAAKFIREKVDSKIFELPSKAILAEKE